MTFFTEMSGFFDICPNVPCAVPIASRILKLHKKLLNNILYGNTEGFLDISIVNKMTEILKPLKSPKNGQF